MFVMMRSKWIEEEMEGTWQLKIDHVRQFTSFQRELTADARTHHAGSQHRFDFKEN